MGLFHPILPLMLKKSNYYLNKEQGMKFEDKLKSMTFEEKLETIERLSPSHDYILNKLSHITDILTSQYSVDVNEANSFEGFFELQHKLENDPMNQPIIEKHNRANAIWYKRHDQLHKRQQRVRNSLSWDESEQLIIS